MMRRYGIILMAMILAGLVMVQPASAQARSVFWERWDVIISDVDPVNNQFNVQEIYDVRFSGSFSFGSAVIPDDRLEAIRNIEVYEGEQLLQASCSRTAGTYCVSNVSEGVSIEYYFTRPIVNATRRFRITYTVVGALRVYEGGDQLWWIAVPEEHFGFPIGSSTISVEMPAGYGPREGIDPVETYGAPGRITVRGTRIEAVATRQIGGHEAFEIRVQYPHHPDARKAAWQDSFDRQREFEETLKPVIDLGLIGISALIAIGGPLAIFAIWYTRGRDPKVGPVPKFLTEPPSDLPPAVVGALVDEKADLRDVLSTVIHLGSREYLVIEETRTEGVVFGIGARSTFTFKRTDKPLTDLRPFEQNIVKKLFGSDLTRPLDQLKYKFFMYVPQLQEDLYDELVREKLFTMKPSATRQIWTGIGWGILIVAVVLGFLLSGQVERVSGVLMCLPLAIGAPGVAALTMGQVMPAKTRKGAEEAAKWNAFREYLGNLERYGNLEAASAHFDKYLAYAIAFGLDRSWIRKFSKVQTTPVPTWYFPTYRGGHYGRGYSAGTPLGDYRSDKMPSAGDLLPGELARAGGRGGLDDLAGGISGSLESISSGLTNMLESASRTFTSRPKSSGGSGRWSSGGRSFSGGGFRGGGGSGGGSRGFG